jgi:hypothetical protein
VNGSSHYFQARAFRFKSYTTLNLKASYALPTPLHFFLQKPNIYTTYISPTMIHGLSKTQRLSIAIGISFSFFAAEISGSSILEGKSQLGA